MAMYDAKPKEPANSGLSIGKIVSSIFDKSLYVIAVLALGVVVYLVLITPHQVDGFSMNPTFVNDEYMLANKQTYNIVDFERGDVIIYKFNENTDFIKRVIALPGETVSIQNGAVYIDGEKLDESDYLADTVTTEQGAFLKEGQSYTVQPGEVFAMGDNRPGSKDSREFGPSKESEIKGQVFMVIYPFSAFRIISSPSY